MPICPENRPGNTWGWDACSDALWVVWPLRALQLVAEKPVTVLIIERMQGKASPSSLQFNFWNTAKYLKDFRLWSLEPLWALKMVCVDEVYLAKCILHKIWETSDFTPFLYWGWGTVFSYYVLVYTCLWPDVVFCFGFPCLAQFFDTGRIPYRSAHFWHLTV